MQYVGFFYLSLIYIILSSILFQSLVKLCLGNLDKTSVLSLSFTRRLYCLVFTILLSKFFLIAKCLSDLGNKSW